MHSCDSITTSEVIFLFFFSDRRVADWFLVRSPLPVIGIFISYMFLVNYGPRIMEKRPAFKLKYLMLIYNTFQVGLSAYMFYEFLVTAILSRYNLTCQPVDTSMDPLALRVWCNKFRNALNALA